MITLIDVSCKHCKKVFKVHPYRKDTALFCSLSCSAKSKTGDKHPRKRAEESRTCVNCGKVYIVNKNYDRKISFCSVMCSAKYSFSGARNWKWGGDIQPVICPVCSKPFMPKRLGAVNKFCSKECRSIGNKIKQVCAGCGKERYVHKSRIDEGRKFCSQECYRHNKIRPTFIEKTIQDRLSDIGIFFIPEYKVGRYFVDIFIPSANLAIECDGSYWHKDRGNNDAKKTNILKSKGYRVLRFGEKKIKQSPQECIDSIVSVVRKIK